MSEEELNPLDKYIGDDGVINISTDFVLFLNSLENHELTAVSNLVFMLMAIRYELDPQELAEQVALVENFRPTAEEWEGGVKSYLQVMLINATTDHEAPASND